MGVSDNMKISNTDVSKRHCPRVSVLMCVYNEGHYLSEAIESILNQTYRDFEFLIINDGSTDSSREIILSYDDPRIRLVDNPKNMGLPKSLNRGLELARGTLICRMDSDDISFPERLEKQIPFMEKNPDVLILGAQHTNFRMTHHLKKPSTTFPTTDIGIKWNLMFGPILSHTAVVYRKGTVWNELGGYDPYYAVEEDKELWSRCVARYSTECIRNFADALVWRRLHPRAVTQDMAHPRRLGHVGRAKLLAKKNMMLILEKKEIPVEWYGSWMDIDDANASVDPLELVGFAKAIKSVQQRFLELYPEAARNHEIPQHIAQMKCRVALYLARRSRVASMRVFVGTVIADLTVFLRASPRYFGILLLGGRVKKIKKLLRRQ